MEVLILSGCDVLWSSLGDGYQFQKNWQIASHSTAYARTQMLIITHRMHPRMPRHVRLPCVIGITRRCSQRGSGDNANSETPTAINFLLTGAVPIIEPAGAVLEG